MENLETKETFEVRDLQSATWVFRKLREIEEKVDEITAVAIEEKERISVKYNTLLENKKDLPLSGEIYLTIDDKIECRIEASLLDNKKERTIEIVGEKGKLNFDMFPRTQTGS